MMKVYYQQQLQQIDKERMQKDQEAYERSLEESRKRCFSQRRFFEDDPQELDDKY